MRIRSLGTLHLRDQFGQDYNVLLYYKMYMKLNNEEFNRMTKKLTREVIAAPPKKRKLTLKEIFFTKKKKNKSK